MSDHSGEGAGVKERVMVRGGARGFGRGERKLETGRIESLFQFPEV